MNESYNPVENDTFYPTELPETRGRNAFEKLSFLFMTGQLITRKKKPYPQATIEQTLPIRADRANRYHKALRYFHDRKNKENHQPLAELKAKSHIEQEFLNIRALRRESDGVTSTYTILNEDKFGQTDMKPLVIISGASNGVESMDSFVRELAFINPNRPIIVMAYPEAASEGHVSQRFFDEVASDEGVKPHADLFKVMIDYVRAVYDIEEIDLLGYSTGAIISAELMARPEMQELVGRAVFICPGGARKQTKEEFKSGIYNETRLMLKMLAGGKRNIGKFIRNS